MAANRPPGWQPRSNPVGAHGGLYAAFLKLNFIAFKRLLRQRGHCTLLSVNQQVKCSGNGCRIRVWPLCCRRGSGSEIRRRQVDVVRFGIERHGLGAVLRLYRFDFAIFVRRVFMEDVDIALPGRGKNQPRLRFKNIRVRSRADGCLLYTSDAADE